jgi:hypothetical protein
VISATTITCTTPAHAAGAVVVMVTVGAQSGTLSGGYTYISSPPTPTPISGASGGSTHCGMGSGLSAALLFAVGVVRLMLVGWRRRVGE